MSSMYVRIKRLNQTYFEEVDPSDSFLSIKERLGVEMNQEPQNIQFWHADKERELVDLATIADQEIENDAVIYMCLRPSESDQFEGISIQEYEDIKMSEDNKDKPTE